MKLTEKVWLLKNLSELAAMIIGKRYNLDGIRNGTLLIQLGKLILLFQVLNALRPQALITTLANAKILF